MTDKQEEIVSRYDLRDTTWTYKGAEGNLHFYFQVAEQAIRLCEYWGDCPDVAVFYIRDNFINWYWHDESLRRLREQLLDRVHGNDQVLEDLRSDWEKRLRRFDTIMDELDSTELAKLSDEDLADRYLEFSDAYVDEYALAITLQDAFSMYAEEFLLPVFQEAFGEQDDFDELLSLLTKPTVESFVNEEYKERLQILQARNRGEDVTSKLEEHAADYRWLQNNYAQHRCLSAEDFEAMLDDMDIDPGRALEEMETPEEVREEKQSVIEELDLGEELRDLIDITEVFGYMQDERKRYVLKAVHYQDRFLDELTDRLDVDRELLQYSHIYEACEWLRGEPVDRDVLRKRQRNGVMIIYTTDGYEVVSGATARTIHDDVFTPDTSEQDSVEGKTAMEGNATGTVKVVKKAEEFERFNEGDVLVTTMTRPEMTPLMKRAAAIVTDEGGITSHAAVVSRELGKPCVIGTEHATAILDDGDEVEVDADEGVVRVLQNNLKSQTG